MYIACDIALLLFYYHVWPILRGC